MFSSLYAVLHNFTIIAVYARLLSQPRRHLYTIYGDYSAARRKKKRKFRWVPDTCRLFRGSRHATIFFLSFHSMPFVLSLKKSNRGFHYMTFLWCLRCPASLHFPKLPGVLEPCCLNSIDACSSSRYGQVMHDAEKVYFSWMCYLKFAIFISAYFEDAWAGDVAVMPSIIKAEYTLVKSPHPCSARKSLPFPFPFSLYVKTASFSASHALRSSEVKLAGREG